MTAATLVWILMTTTKPYSGSTHAVQYSPPVAELADCQRMKDALDTGNSRCVQIRMVIGVQNDRTRH